MATRVQLRDRIKRNLGHPMVKVELCDDHINDAINIARDMWIRWAVGNATHERWLTLLLRPGRWLYDLPSGVVEVVNYYDSQGRSGGSNHTYDSGGPQQLFSLDNAMYMQGFMNPNFPGGGGFGMQSFNLIGYESVRQYMGMLEHYQYNKYNWYYHKSTNQLEIQPTPACDVNKYLNLDVDISNGSLSLYTMENPSCSVETSATVVRSEGFVLLKTYMIEGAPLPTYVPPTSGSTINSVFNITDNYSEHIFNEPWIINYVTALCKVTLGGIRRKFSGYSSLGNQGISLDGSDLISEGKEEMLRLEEELPLKYAHEGYGIYLM